VAGGRQFHGSSVCGFVTLAGRGRTADKTLVHQVVAAFQASKAWLRKVRRVLSVIRWLVTLNVL
jgi:hypothetical protein